MRFKKGSKVEVFSKKEFPCGCWRYAEIVSGNGHYYDVKYDWALGGRESPIVERVSRKVIRPSPPPVYSLRDCLSGDLVEVFENLSWKVAIVLKVMGEKYYLVRLLGSSREVRAHKSQVRVRQIWKNNEWAIVGKGVDGCKDDKLDPRCYQNSTHQVVGIGRKRKLLEEDDYFPFENNNDFQESHMVSSRTMKRGSPVGLSYPETQARAGQKIRAVEKDGGHQRVAAVHPSSLPAKVDAVACPQHMLGEKHMHTSFYNQIYEMDTGRREPNGDVGRFSGRNIEFSNTESSACSVGSCSINSNSPFRILHCLATDPSYDSDTNSSDAESFCGWRPEKKDNLPSKEDVAVEIHKLELHAYRSTMGALYHSGPLSWEQEALMTNLRLMLHISNDEHLLELRSLVSGETNLITR